MPAMGILRFKQLYPPFDKPEARRALLSVVDQAEAMTVVAGVDRANWLDGIGLFSHDTPLANDAGIDVLRRPRDPAAAKKALAEAGYGGEKIVVIAPTELAGIRGLSLIGADQMRRAGLNVDLQETDFATVVKRRTSQSPPDKGGWNVFFTMIDRSIPNIHPFGTRRCGPTAKPLTTAGPTARASRNCAAPGSTPAILPSIAVSPPSCKCRCGR